MDENGELRKKIHENIKEYYDQGIRKKDEFIPGKTRIRYAGAVYDHEEITAVLDALLDGWFGLGKKAAEFEKGLTQYIGCNETILTNSGSSSNLLAVSALLSEQFPERLNAGDEVITPACTFPTTFNPIIQNNLTPVVVDVELGTYNMKVEDLERATSERTKLIMIPHTLGNLNEMDAIMDFAKEKNIFVIEDTCDALGSKYDGKMAGSFGILGTLSMYPAHHITTGEGGAIFVNDMRLSRIIKSIRDWGRACYCSSTEKNPNGACENRFNFKIDGINYDHKYMYSHIGYNLKPIEQQAAMGVEQLKKLDSFIKARKKNFKILYEEFSKYEDLLILPETLPKADPSWFAFPLTIRDENKIKRYDLLKWLEQNGIETRLLFAGNIIRQPAYKNVKYRKMGNLENSDKIMKDTFLLGVYPGMDEEKLKYIAEKFKEFVSQVRGK